MRPLLRLIQVRRVIPEATSRNREARRLELERQHPPATSAEFAEGLEAELKV